MDTPKRFEKWQPPEFDERGLTKWNWMCQNPENLEVGQDSDIGAFCYINAKHGVSIGSSAQIGSHTSIYSWSSIDNKAGKVTIGDGACVGSHCTIMPGVTIGKNSIVGAHSFVTSDVPPGSLAYGIPCRVVRPRREGHE